jgi:CRISPR type III-B/RAMP module RAMP protein Cmr1
MQSTVIKGQNFMKQEYPIVRLDVIDADSIADQLVIYFDESTSRQFDLVGDAYYLPSMRKDAPRFYALEGNSKASIVGRPVDVTDSVQVVFGSTKNQSKFYIHAELDELEEGWFVYLRDKKDNKTYVLEDKKSLAFNHYGGLTSERFVVYYTKQANAFAHLVSGEDARILPFVRNNQLVLQSFGISGAAQINAFDAIGRLVHSENTNLDLGQERVLDFPPSEKLLFIQVNIGGNSFVEKVYF